MWIVISFLAVSIVALGAFFVHAIGLVADYVRSNEAWQKELDESRQRHLEASMLINQVVQGQQRQIDGLILIESSRQATQTRGDA